MSYSVRTVVGLAVLAVSPAPLLLWLGLSAIGELERVDREQRTSAAREAFCATVAAAPAGAELALAVDVALDAAPEFANAAILGAAAAARDGRVVDGLELLEPLLSAQRPPRLRIAATLEAARSFAHARSGRSDALRAAAQQLVVSHADAVGAAFTRYVTLASAPATSMGDVSAWAAELMTRPSTDEEVVLVGRLLAEVPPGDARAHDAARADLDRRRGWPRVARILAARAAAAPANMAVFARVDADWYALSGTRTAARRLAFVDAVTGSGSTAEVTVAFTHDGVHVDPGDHALTLALPRSTLFFGAPARVVLVGAVSIYGVLAFVLIGAVLRQQRRAHALAQARADLVAQVTHELRTPLAVVRLYGESLLAHRVEPAARQEYLETITRETTRLGELVDRVAAAAHAEHAEHPIVGEPIDPGPVVAAGAQTIARIVERGGGTLTITDGRVRDARVAITRDALRLVLDVVFDNALRYGGDPPLLDVELADEASALRIAVRDHGPGIDARERERVFERFERGSAGIASGTRGAGMGLWLARRAARQAGGDVLFEFPVDGGTRVVLRLPYAPVEGAP